VSKQFHDGTSAQCMLYIAIEIKKTQRDRVSIGKNINELQYN